MVLFGLNPLNIGKIPIIINMRANIKYIMKTIFFENRAEKLYWKLLGELIGWVIISSAMLIILFFTG